MFAIALNLASAAGAISFAWIDDWLGPKRTIAWCLLGLVGFGIPLLLASSQFWFWVFALGLGIFVGPAQAAGRSMMARLSPPGMETEMFGLYALSGRAVSFFGPLALAWATEFFANQRAGMATIVLLLTLGLLLLLGVSEDHQSQ